MPRNNEVMVPASRVRQEKQRFYDVVFHHLLHNKDALTSLEAAKGLVEYAALLQDLWSESTVEDRTLLIRSGKYRPSGKHAGDLVERPSVIPKVTPRFKVVRNPVHHPIEGSSVLRGKHYNTVLQAVRQAGEDGATNQQISAECHIPVKEATGILVVLRKKGLLNKRPIPNRSMRGPVNRYTAVTCTPKPELVLTERVASI